jgi:hypothetical protein
MPARGNVTPRMSEAGGRSQIWAMGAHAETRVESLPELIEKVTPREPEESSGRRRSYAVFRGAVRGPQSLLTTLDRLGGIDPPHAKAHLEEHILRNFMRYARPHVGPGDDEWELLFTAQHHGLPTRLLDWTHSPLVAAHFATLGAPPDTDRVIWRLDWRRVHERFGLRPVAFLVEDLARALEERGVRSPWEFFGRSSDMDGGFAVMLEPPALDGRITAQSAAFTICSVRDRPFAAFLAEHELSEALTELVIPAAAVALIRDQLDICAVDERRLFPDLDGVARELGRYYASSGPES